MNDNFNRDKAKEFLENRESLELKEQEIERIATLSRAKETLIDYFSNSDVTVYLVGSILQPYKFTPFSDIDIVLQNLKGDRFDVWTELETRLLRNVEIILFEKCHFQEYVIKNGYKVL